MADEPKTLYVKVGDEYCPMQKVEYDAETGDNAQGWTAKYNDEDGELFWEEL